ncbi:metallophosphoesterase [Chloroflexi bacterium TSY]|nr:metallophosphoesterase [Chloroflexi bacterium TSY]
MTPKSLQSRLKIAKNAKFGSTESIMRILILSDIHANLIALEKVLEDAKDNYDRVWCLGDVIGYGPRPNECVEIIRDIADICVIGNHDWAGLGRPGIDVDAFNPQARQAVLWTREQLTDDNRTYLEKLPDEPVQPEVSEHFIATHASPRQPVWEYVMTPSIAMENFSAFDEQICLVGHTHKPAIYRWRLHDLPNQDSESEIGDGRDSTSNEANNRNNRNGQAQVETLQQVATVDYLQPQEDIPLILETSETQRLIVNPGSVGQPRDNDARAAYAILDLDEMSWNYYRVPYPVELTQNQMRSADLPKRLVDRLSFGW